MKKYLSIALALSMVLSLFTGCGSTSSDVSDNASSISGSTGSSGEKTIVIAATRELPHFNVNAIDWQPYTSMSIYGALFKKSITGKLINDLCESYTISDDGLEYVFNLRKGVKWHDGEPFTSKDVKYTYDAIKEFKGQHVEKLRSLKEVVCPDEYTVVFKMSEIDSSLLPSLSMVKILAAHLYEGTDWLNNPANQNPVGTGPFKFVEYKKGAYLTLEAYDDYFLGRPAIDKLIFKTIPDENTIVQAFLNREIDIIDPTGPISPAAIPILEKEPNVVISTEMTTSRQVMVTNLSKKPWDDIRVRRAVALAIDRDMMVEKAHKGLAAKAEGFYTPGVEWAYADEYKLPERDIEEAKRLLDEAGYKPDANGVRIKDVDLAIFQFAVFSDLSKIITANLKEVGIECKVSNLEYSAWEEKCKNGDFDIALVGGNFGPDPDHMQVRIGDGGLLNFMKYHNDDIERLLKEGRQEPDLEKRGTIYKEMQRIMSEELPIIPLTEWCSIDVWRDNITGHYSQLPDTAGGQDYYYLDIK